MTSVDLEERGSSSTPPFLYRTASSQTCLRRGVLSSPAPATRSAGGGGRIQQESLRRVRSGTTPRYYLKGA
jgi:hypothetical protein